MNSSLHGQILLLYDDPLSALVTSVAKLRPNPKKNMVYGTLVFLYARADNLTLCPLQHIYHGQPYARVDLNPMPELTFLPSKGLWIWPLSKVFWAGPKGVPDCRGRVVFEPWVAIQLQPRAKIS